MAAVSSLLAPVAAGLAAVEAVIAEEVAAIPEPPRGSVAAVVEAGGKRLRPALTLLAAGAPEHPSRALVRAAAGLELIHTATLIHDDVIDASPTRRGVAAVHAASGIPHAILAGDRLLTRGIALVADAGDAAAAAVTAAAVAEICTGEFIQQEAAPSPDRARPEYEATIRAKTSALLVACVETGARLGGRAGTLAALRTYGEELGLAFQIADDTLDYTADATALGKPAGADLAAGMVTLPLIIALEDDALGPRLRSLLRDWDTRAAVTDDVVTLVSRSPAPALALEEARAHAQAARAATDALPDDAAAAVLRDLCAYVVDRPA